MGHPCLAVAVLKVVLSMMLTAGDPCFKTFTRLQSGGLADSSESTPGAGSNYYVDVRTRPLFGPFYYVGVRPPFWPFLFRWCAFDPFYFRNFDVFVPHVRLYEVVRFTAAF